ncbi:MAG: phosphatidylserine decarboxylase [Vigna little leaf phytoplasma]|nr:phosphatidylserine decarboxylase [Vigna little leaf phytoplasma]
MIYETKKNNRKQKKEKLHFLYYNLEKKFWKRLILKIIISHWFNVICSFYLKTFISKIHIKKIVKKANINIALFEKQKFKSYNDFFIRKYKNVFFCKDPNIFISPGEGFIRICPILSQNNYTIKQTKYHLSDLLKNDSLPNYYNKGYLVILRLAPTNYHRYIFIDNGSMLHHPIKIKGKLHTVQPIAFKYYNVFHENSREYSILQTNNFGKIIQVEVGALLIGKINNHRIYNFNKGEEKGFFSIGGSTIVLLVKTNMVDFNSNILKRSAKNLETKVNLGQSIGRKKCIF